MPADSPLPSAPAGNARERLLDAAMTTVRAKGFTATSIDELCAAAGVTKGAFFHHFPSKEALGVAGAHYWTETTGPLFESAPYHDHADPLDRVLGYLDFRLAIIEGTPADYGCFAGTTVQEMFGASDVIRAACGASITGHARRLEADIAAAMAAHGVTGISPASLALHFQAVVQGAIVIGKATGDTETARDQVRHLRRYVELLFAAKPQSRAAKGASPAATEEEPR
jgi:TetR/AcrR family transcriptional repressor of nem operon